MSPMPCQCCDECGDKIKEIKELETIIIEARKLMQIQRPCKEWSEGSYEWLEKTKDIK